MGLGIDNEVSLLFLESRHGNSSSSTKLNLSTRHSDNNDRHDWLVVIVPVAPRSARHRRRRTTTNKTEEEQEDAAGGRGGGFLNHDGEQYQGDEEKKWILLVYCNVVSTLKYLSALGHTCQLFYLHRALSKECWKVFSRYNFQRREEVNQQSW